MGCCVYKITNKVNSMVYIGASDLSRKPRDSMKHRFEEHKKYALHGVKKVLYDAMREHGIENFSVKLVAVCSGQEEMYAKEIEVINEVNSWYPNGYNVRKGRQKKTVDE